MSGYFVLEKKLQSRANKDPFSLQTGAGLGFVKVFGEGGGLVRGWKRSSCQWFGIYDRRSAMGAQSALSGAQEVGGVKVTGVCRRTRPFSADPGGRRGREQVGDLMSMGRRAELIGGILDIHSAPGQGTILTVSGWERR